MKRYSGKGSLFVDDRIAYLKYPKKSTENFREKNQSRGQLKDNIKKKNLFYILSVINLNINKSQRELVIHFHSQKTYQMKGKCPFKTYHFNLRIPRIKKKILKSSRENERGHLQMIWNEYGIRLFNSNIGNYNKIEQCP